MRGGGKGIEAWEGIQWRTVDGTLCLRKLASVRLLLREGSKPDDLPQQSWDTYQKYLRYSRGPEFLAFVLAFEWSTGQEEPADLCTTIQKSIVARGWAQSEEEAQGRYDALFVHVFRLLSTKGAKRLTTADRDTVLAQLALSDTDRKILRGLGGAMTRLATKVKNLEAKVEQHDASIVMLQVGQREIIEMAHAQGITGTITAFEAPPDLSLPLGATVRAPRSTTVGQLVGLLRGHTWVAIYGTSGSGKTELALLVALAAVSGRTWLTLRDLNASEAVARLNAAIAAIVGSPPGANRAVWYETFCAHLGRDHVVVVDDVPQFEADSMFGNQLTQLALTFRQRGLKLLTTSALSVPSRLSSRLGDTILKFIPAPPFTDEEAGELLYAHGAPPDWCDKGRARFINAVTGGHAELLTTAALFLKDRDWDFSEEALDSLLHRNYATSVEAETMRRLETTVPDETTRELLFRAALILGAFTIDDVKAVAGVEPEIAFPKGKLAALERQTG